MRSALKMVGVISLVGMLVGCVSGPRESNHWVFFDPPDSNIRIPSDSKPVVAIAGVMQRDSYSDAKADRKISTTPEDLKPIFTGISSGLIEDSSAKVHLLDQVSVEIDCPELKDVKQAAATKRGGDFRNLFEGQTCLFPKRLEDSASIESMRLRGIGHLVLIVAEAQEAPQGTDFEMGLVGGGPAPAPGLAINIAIHTGYLFRVSATLYDLSSLVAIMKASASAYDQASLGVLLTILPVYIAPDEKEYLSSLARAVGLEIGRRFTTSDTSTEITGIVGRGVEGAREFQALPSGAPDQQPGATSIPKHLLDFANGKAEMITPGVTTGFAAAWAAASNGQLTKGLHDTGRWESLATVVLEDKFGDNLGWYYLGRAAEGMGLCDTAEHYYMISGERSESFWTRCFSTACYGIKLPEVLEERLTAIEAMRSMGKCSAPPMPHH